MNRKSRQSTPVKPSFILPLTDRGTYSELNVLALGIVYARTMGKEFFVDDRGWAPSHRLGLAEFFDTTPARWSGFSPHMTAFRHSFRSRLSTLVFNSLSQQPTIPAANAFDEFMSAEFWRNTLGFSGDSMVNDWLFREKRLVFQNIYRFNAATQERISSVLQAFDVTRPYCAIHIRRGDKITTKEMQEINLAKYADAITKQSLTNILVFSDEYSVFEELCGLLKTRDSERKLVNCIDNSSAGFSEKHYRKMHAEDRVSAVTRMFAEMELMRNAQYLICTFSSNVSRFAALYVGLENCLSLDTGWHPY